METGEKLVVTMPVPPLTPLCLSTAPLTRPWVTLPSPAAERGTGGPLSRDDYSQQNPHFWGSRSLAHHVAPKLVEVTGLKAKKN